MRNYTATLPNGSTIKRESKNIYAFAFQTTVINAKGERVVLKEGFSNSDKGTIGYKIPKAHMRGASKEQIVEMQNYNSSFETSYTKAVLIGGPLEISARHMDMMADMLA